MDGNMVVQREVLNPKWKIGRKWLYGGVAVVVVLGAGLTTVLMKRSSSPALSASNTYRVAYGSVTQTVATSGTIQTPTEINLNFTGVSGVAKKVYVHVGDHVKAGQALLQLDDASQQVQVAQAEAGVAQAKANLTKAEEPANTASLAVNQAAVQKAQAALDGAKQQYQDQLNLYNDRSSAQQQIATAQNTLAMHTQTVTQDQQAVTNAQNNVSSTKQALDTAQAEYGNITSDQVQSAYQKYQGELSLYNWWQQNYGSGTNPYETAMSADNTYYTQLNSGYQALQTAQQNYSQAQTALQSAQTALAKDQLQVQQDQQSLQFAQDAYNNRTQAQQALDNAKNQVDQAQANLSSAQATLQQAQQPADPAAVQAAQASVQSAEAQLQSAQLVESNTMLKAPIDGVITQVNFKQGEVVAASSPAVVLDDTVASDLQVNLQVSESQIGTIKPGQSIQVSVSAYPGKTYEGTITQVYPTPQVVSNVTEYTVLASVNNSSGELKPGMTGNVSIQTATKNNVLVVPAISLQEFGNIEGVYVVGNSTSSQAGGNGIQTSKRYSGSFVPKGVKLPAGVHFQPVQVGLFGTGTVEITRGLQQGEEILRVPPGQAAPTSSSTSSSTGRGGFGGGFGGGGGGFGGRGGGGGGQGGKG